MKEHCYRAFGLPVRSEIPLELPPGFPDAGDGSIEVLSRPVPPAPDLPWALGQVRYGAVGETLQFDVPWAGRFSLEPAGLRILVDAEGRAREDLAGLYVTGLLLPVLISRRGSINLHGAAVAGERGALVILGQKGAGKSTTAAALSMAGYRLLCDDLVPIGPGPQVLPGIPVPKLLPDAYGRLIGPAEARAAVSDGLGKYRAQVPSSEVRTPLRLILCLETGEAAGPEALPLKGAAKIKAILGNAVALKGISDPAELFSLATAQLATASCYRLIRPAAADSLDEVVRIAAGLDRDMKT